jgi:hypothetical protein
MRSQKAKCSAGSRFCRSKPSRSKSHSRVVGIIVTNRRPVVFTPDGGPEDYCEGVRPVHMNVVFSAETVLRRDGTI